MFDSTKNVLIISKFDPDGIALDLFSVSKILESVWLSRSIKKKDDNLFVRLFSVLRKRGVDIPDKAEPLFGLVEALKYMRFWCWAIEKCIEIHGKYASPELLEFYAADRREYERLTNPTEVTDGINIDIE